MDRLKAGSADGRLEALTTLFATTARDLNLTVPSNISLLKMESMLTVIASQLFSELKALVVVAVVVHDFFYHYIMNKCYLQLLTSVPDVLK